MSRLATQRTNNKTLLDLAGRIDVSQADEIAFMQTWLREREEMAPEPSKGHQGHKMAGMATPRRRWCSTPMIEPPTIGFDAML